MLESQPFQWAPSICQSLVMKQTASFALPFAKTRPPFLWQLNAWGTGTAPTKPEICGVHLELALGEQHISRRKAYSVSLGSGPFSNCDELTLSMCKLGALHPNVDRVNALRAREDEERRETKRHLDDLERFGGHFLQRSFSHLLRLSTIRPILTRLTTAVEEGKRWKTKPPTDTKITNTKKNTLPLPQAHKSKWHIDNIPKTSRKPHVFRHPKNGKRPRCRPTALPCSMPAGRSRARLSGSKTAAPGATDEQMDR